MYGVCGFVWQSVSHCVCLSSFNLCLLLCVSESLPVARLWLSVSVVLLFVCMYDWLALSLCLWVCVLLYLFVSISLCVCISFCHLSVSVSLCLCVCLCLPVSLWLWLCLWMSVCNYLYVFVSHTQCLDVNLGRKVTKKPSSHIPPTCKLLIQIYILGLEEKDLSQHIICALCVDKRSRY